MVCNHLISLGPETWQVILQHLKNDLEQSHAGEQIKGS